MNPPDRQQPYTSGNRRDPLPRLLSGLDGLASRPAAACLVCLAILWFGLWPLRFHPPNDAHRLQGRNGLAFHTQGVSSRPATYGIAYSDGQVRLAGRAVTIELWLEPQSQGAGALRHILSFHDGGRQEPLIIAQWQSYLVVRSRLPGPRLPRPYREISLADVLRPGRETFITLASGPRTTRIYVNGEPGKSVAQPAFIEPAGLAGRLVLGNSPRGANPWHGRLYGLAIYDRQLTPEQVRRSYRNWTADPNARPEPANAPAVMYTFAGPEGPLVRNVAEDENHLLLPATFSALDKKVLALSADDLAFGDATVALDAVRNILAFAAFGYCAAAYLAAVVARRRALWYLVPVFAGIALSLAIELTQAQLPGRDSSPVDLLCNTVGTALGVLLSRWSFGRVRPALKNQPGPHPRS